VALSLVFYWRIKRRRKDVARRINSGYFALGVSSFAAARSPVATGMPPACPVTKPNGSRPPDQRPNPNYNGNGVLWTTLWDEKRR